jgi:putative tryptophan/tyrosine transport system substrate-binding protein
VKRRAFIAGLGSAAAWSVVTRAQQTERMRRVGVLMQFGENYPLGTANFSGFMQGLAELGWNDGRNVRMDVRWAEGSVDRMRMFAKDLVDLQPDVILAASTPVTAALQRETRTIPIIFTVVGDPVGSGFVASLARPDGNITGFTNYEASMGGKWLQLLTEIAPGVKRAAIMFNPETSPSGGSVYLPSFETAALSLKVLPIIAPVHSEADIETAIIALGREPGGGLVVNSGAYMNVHSGLVILRAAQNNVPAVFSISLWASDGGLLSYGPDEADEHRRAASYVDRILRGAKPADLPVQLPVKFKMVVNLKTAKALGLSVPQSILLQADEVIE